MRTRRTKNDDYLGPSRGLAKWMHRLVMFILWPLRHPLWFILILIIAYLAPTFMGVKPVEVHLWYWRHLRQSSSQVSALVGSHTKNILPELPKIEFPSMHSAVVEQEPEAPQVVDMPQRETRRKMFEKAKSAPVAIDIMVEKQKALPAAETAAPAVVTPPAKKLALVYVENPRNLSGPAKVVNANELIINGENIFLYGIYANPQSTAGQNAKKYLEEIVADKTVDCVIGAYTLQAIATGICTVGNLNINKALVDAGYSKDVALTSQDQ